LSKEKIILNGLKKLKLNLLSLILFDHNTNSDDETRNQFRFMNWETDYAKPYNYDNVAPKLRLSPPDEIINIKTAQLSKNAFNWQCLQFKKAESIDIHLLWNYWNVGIPERENFKIISLQKNKPVEIYLNGKTEFSMTSRRATTYNERNFIVEYFGEFDEFEFVDESDFNFTKKIPVECKRINLLKHLY